MATVITNGPNVSKAYGTVATETPNDSEAVCKAYGLVVIETPRPDLGVSKTWGYVVTEEIESASYVIMQVMM